VTLNLIVGGLILGNATMLNVLLEPGNNTVAARGIVDLELVIEHLPQIIESQASALQSGNLEISASGNSTIYDGQHIEYYEDILSNLTLTAQVPILTLLFDTLKGLLGGSSSVNSSSPLNLTSLLSGLNATNILPLLGNLSSELI
jgi:hypothetical protein